MAFETYIENIKKLTGKNMEQIKEHATVENIIAPDMKASVFTDWLNKEYNLGKGHGMAVWKYFIEQGWIVTKNSKI